MEEYENIVTEHKRHQIIRLNIYAEAYADARVKEITETCFTFLNAAVATLLFTLSGALTKLELDNSNIMNYLTMASNITGVIYTAKTLKSAFLTVRAITRKIVFKKRATDLKSEIELEQMFEKDINQNLENEEKKSRGSR